MNRGDTSFLMLGYTINGSPLVEGAYQEMELTINDCGTSKCVRKLLSRNEIEWGSLTYEEDQQERTFTGYYTHLSQEETFALLQGENKVQLRILDNNEVGSSAVSLIALGKALSNEVLTDGSDS